MQARYSLGIIVFVCAGAGIYTLASWLAPQSEKQQEVIFTSAGIPLELPTDTTPPSLGPHRQATAGYVEYYNSHYRFSLFYPKELSVKHYTEGGGASTIIFQNPREEAIGFQIFVTPYGASQVTEEQFKKDEPSGVREGLQNIVIDGADGASFYSNNIVLGETAEVWFIHGGYLYEVTTIKPLTTWLGKIMQTWKFI